jgi:hypothetical protein
MSCEREGRQLRSTCREQGSGNQGKNRRFSTVFIKPKEVEKGAIFHRWFGSLHVGVGNVRHPRGQEQGVWAGGENDVYAKVIGHGVLTLKTFKALVRADDEWA